MKHLGRCHRLPLSWALASLVAATLSISLATVDDSDRGSRSRFLVGIQVANVATPESTDCWSTAEAAMEANGTVVEAALSWDAFVAAMDARSSIADQLNKYRAEHGVPITLRAAPEGVASYFTSGGPCGGGAITFLSRMPIADSAGFSEAVIELGPAGQVLRRWMMPYDAAVEAVRDDTIFVRYRASSLCGRPSTSADDTWIAIQRDGTFEFTDTVEAQEVAVTKCSSSERRVIPEDAWCSRFTADDGEIVTLVFEYPCT